MTAIEKTRDFKGVYHVLMGALSPLQGIGPDDLKIKGLLTRVGRRRRRGSHPRDQSQRRRRSDRDLSRAAAQAARRPGDAHRDGRPGRQRSRIRRRSDHAQGAGRTARSIVSGADDVDARSPIKLPATRAPRARRRSSPGWPATGCSDSCSRSSASSSARSRQLGARPERHGRC